MKKAIIIHQLIMLLLICTSLLSVIASGNPKPNLVYETDKQLSEYTEFHYGDICYDVPNFPKALAGLAIDVTKGRPHKRALDLGCATGRATFELAKHFDQVTGVDFSARFIAAANQMATTGELHYTRTDEGDLVSYQTRSLAELGLSDVAAKVAFSQGNALQLDPSLSNYDLILAANLIDRLYDPKSFISHIHERLNIGGVLLLSSPYTWLEEHTKKEDWLGGFQKNGKDWSTLDALKELLGPHFRMIGNPQDVPFVIRETRRKHQHTLAEVTIWERIS